MERLEEIKQREQAATPGPWSVWTERYETSYGHQDDIIVSEDPVKFASDADIDFMSEARQDIPWLIAEVERLRAENEKK